MSWQAKIEAFERRRLREENKRQREAEKCRRDAERESKAQAKLSALEQARAEVQDYDERIAQLVSAHKETIEPCDWAGLRAAMLPAPPRRKPYHENRARLSQAFFLGQNGDDANKHCRQLDDAASEKEHAEYSRQKSEMEKLKSLACRILDGDHAAYKEALAQFNPFADLSSLGSQLRISVHSAKLLGCVLKVKGTAAIPSEIKTLTSTGKLSTKQMATARFHELYQDCLCSNVLRIALELFALLPVETVLITTLADMFDSGTGNREEHPVLSVALPRARVAQLNLDWIDPSDAIETFLHRGNFKASRKAGAFLPITPLTAEDVETTKSVSDLELNDLFDRARAFQAELTAMTADLQAVTHTDLVGGAIQPC